MTLYETFSLLHEKFRNIRFEPQQHIYTDLCTGKHLVSTTTAIERFKKPFDKEFWLREKAAEAGITVAELEEQWRRKKVRGQMIGIRYHDYMERTFKHMAQQQKPIPAVENYLLEYNDVPLLTEYIIGNEVLGGMVDHVALRGDSLVLKDWKSNKKFYTNSRYRLIKGLEHLPASEFNVYALQTSIYRYMLEPLPIERQECVWFFPPRKEFLSDSAWNDKGYIVFVMPYLRDEAKHIIETVRNDDSATYFGDTQPDESLLGD